MGIYLRQKSVRLSPVGPLTPGILSLKSLVSALKWLRIMSALVARNTTQKNGLGSGLASGIFRKQFVEGLEARLELCRLKVNLRCAQKQGRDKFRRRQKTDRAVVFLAILIESNQSRCPSDIKIFGC